MAIHYGYDLHQHLPDHSSLTKIRERYGLQIFRRFLEVIVERCAEAGLVWGREIYFDSTKVSLFVPEQANPPVGHDAAPQPLHLDLPGAIFAELAEANVVVMTG